MQLLHNFIHLCVVPGTCVYLNFTCALQYTCIPELHVCKMYYHHQIFYRYFYIPVSSTIYCCPLDVLFSLPPSTTTTTTHPINIQPQSPSQCFPRCAPSFQSQIENTHRPHSPHKATRTPVPPQHHGSTNHQFQSPTHLLN